MKRLGYNNSIKVSASGTINTIHFRRRKGFQTIMLDGGKMRLIAYFDPDNNIGRFRYKDMKGKTLYINVELHITKDPTAHYAIPLVVDHII